MRLIDEILTATVVQEQNEVQLASHLAVSFGDLNKLKSDYLALPKDIDIDNCEDEQEEVVTTEILEGFLGLKIVLLPNGGQFKLLKDCPTDY